MASLTVCSNLYHLLISLGSCVSLTRLKSSHSDTIERNYHHTVESRIARFEKQGDFCQHVSGGLLWGKRRGVFEWSTFDWPNLPRLYLPNSSQTSNCSLTSRSSTNPSNVCRCFETVSACDQGLPHFSSRFKVLTGDWRLGLFLLETSWKDNFQSSSYCKTGSGEVWKAMSPSAGLRNFSNVQVKPHKLWDYMCSIMCGGEVNADSEELGKATQDQQRKKHLGVSLISRLARLPITCCRSLHAFDLASKVYRNLDGATISLKLISRPLHKSTWLPQPLVYSGSNRDMHSITDNGRTASLVPATPISLSRQQSFACIAGFESGSIHLDPQELDYALAMCSENSIFVAAVALSDPFDHAAPDNIKRLVGNIGRPGICFLVAPQDPRIRDLSDQYNVVTHAPYDCKRENNFKGTSLHLSFTNWAFPLEASGVRTIDQDVLVVESVISVLDRGKWVADLDILSIDHEGLIRMNIKCKCESSQEQSEYDYTSIDSWEELLDKPEAVGIFRAHGNWAARLAAVSVLSQQGQGHSIAVFGPTRICLKCLEAGYEAFGADLQDYESPLPSFCID